MPFVNWGSILTLSDADITQHCGLSACKCSLPDSLPAAAQYSQYPNIPDALPTQYAHQQLSDG